MDERQAPSLALSFTCPGVERRTGRSGLWIASGLPKGRLDQLVAADDSASAADLAVHEHRDASVVLVVVRDDRPLRVVAWKGLMAVNEVFYAHNERLGWYLTDHLRNAMAWLPCAERSMSDAALLQHYVGAAVYGRATYARGVKRLLNGDRVDIDLKQGTSRIRCFSKHTSMVTDEPIARHLDRIDAAFEDVVGPLRETSGVATAFSGGVDSTLLLTYMKDHGDVVTVVPGSPEFDVETEYAHEAARMAGRTVERIELNEADYLARLETTIETFGMPVESYVTPTLTAMYEHPASVFLVGDGADSVFGSGRGIRRIASALSGRPGRALLDALGRLPGPLGQRAEQIDGYAALFAEEPDSPHGYAGTILEYHGDLSLTAQVFGQEAMTDLNRQMIAEVTERVELDSPEDDRFFRHIEVSLWRWIFADLALAGNHTAHALGKSQVQPYSSWRVISEQMKVPVRRRYYKGLSGKWMLKELLSRRLPEYRVNKRKLATALPFDRYYISGPLSQVWDRYEIPDVIPRNLHDPVRAEPSPMAWKAITHAIWEERVVANADLTPHPAVFETAWELSPSS